MIIAEGFISCCACTQRKAVFQCAVYRQQFAGVAVFASFQCTKDCNTIEELAEKMGCDAETLKATITKWNGFVDAGEDPQFERDMTDANKIETAPFYAVQIKPTQYNTQGGARRNEKAEVLDVSNNPIPNLYSAGEFGSMYADKYNGGSNLMECVAYGQIAAESCCENLSK